MQERLQKIIARAGISSRRAAEELITGGRVRVNGRVMTELGAKADPREDKIEVDGKRLVPPSLLYFVFHKPRNVMSTLADPEGVAWDGGTGSGQFAVLLAKRFRTVIASDASLAQLRTHRDHPRIRFVRATAERSALRDRSI